jgi:galactose mutarotase-like enzyme
MATAAHEVRDERVEGLDGIALLSRAHDLRVAFAPAAGMVGYSLTHRGDELLGLRGGLTAYRERGSTFGIPLLHPWANRLGGPGYSVGGRSVDLDGGRPPVHLDPNGLPIHGVVAGVPYWQESGRTLGGGTVAFGAQLDFGAHDELMATFPFPHELHVQVELHEDTLTVATILISTGSVAVPVSFGWHPYLRLPGVPRADWWVELPVRRRAVLDGRGIPTGRSERVEIEPGPLGERTYDDHFDELDEPATFVLEGGGRRIELGFGEGYSHAQVYAPLGTGEEPYVCFEPMTAAVNALVSGEGLRSVPPGGSFRADFTIRVS